MHLENSVAILIGAGRINGIGAATAKLLAQEGCHVLINCIKNEVQANQVVNECRSLGVEADLFLGDVTSHSICAKLENHVRSKWGRAEILVNCLGATKPASYENLDQLSVEDFHYMFSANVIAPYLMAQVFKPLLKQSSHAAIVNISSAAGITGKGSSIAYAAAKGAENTLTLALAQALAPEIRVNAVCPNFVDSSWWEESFAGKEEKYKALVNNMRESNVLGRVLTPQDVAYTILSVIKNPIMTGELIRIDSGAHLGSLKQK
jgi:3-oxoacyl-[acyl-carrier protein] reductase